MQDEQREKDIQELCNSVLNSSPSVYYNPHGADRSTCQICFSSVPYADAEMEDIAHALNCGYLIAKDLLTK